VLLAVTVLHNAVGLRSVPCLLPGASVSSPDGMCLPPRFIAIRTASADRFFDCSSGLSSHPDVCCLTRACRVYFFYAEPLSDGGILVSLSEPLADFPRICDTRSEALLSFVSLWVVVQEPTFSSPCMIVLPFFLIFVSFSKDLHRLMFFRYNSV